MTMEVENMNSKIASRYEEDDAPLPGFRFHPTDQELVGFYLTRKVEKKPISIELIKQADIYKYDPWDLPKSNTVGDKEWYFYCKRGRKYRNSVRPNRVTGSGFWKATGIDRPIYSSNGDCIGLKKSLVYYRGSAGKGTKTDWMMHEFRLPPTQDKINKNLDLDQNMAQEAEVWTLCRILKRNISYRRCVPDWKEMTNKKMSIMDPVAVSSKPICSIQNRPNIMSNYISFNASAAVPYIRQNEKKPCSENIANQQLFSHFMSSSSDISQSPNSAASSLTNPRCADINDLLRYADWEDLQAMVENSDVATNYPTYT